MRKILWLAFLLPLFMPLPCRAQHLHGVEVFGGYSYLRDGISTTAQPVVCAVAPSAPFNPCPTIFFGKDAGLNGWQASLTENATKSFGITEEFAGHYGNGTFQGFNYHFNEFSVLAGPRLSYPHFKSVTPFAHALFGYGRTNLGGSLTEGSFAFALGGGLDAKVNRHMGIRLFQADYYRTTILHGTQNSLEISAGIFFHFGKW